MSTMSRREMLSAVVGVVSAMGTCASAEEKTTGFKIGVCDWMTGKAGDPDVMRVCAELGLDGAMVSFGAPGEKFDLRREENRRLYFEANKRHGTAIASLGMGILNSIPYKSDPRTEEWVNDSIDVSKMLGTAIVLLAFFGKGDLKNDKPGTDEVIKRLKRIAPKAEKEGVVLGIESWLSADEHMHILDSVGSPNIQCYYDVGNSFKMGYDIYTEIRQLGRRHICEFHAKDYADKLFGQGDIDFWEVRRAMDDIGYRGWFHLEGPQPLGLMRSYRHDRNFLKAIYPPA